MAVRIQTDQTLYLYEAEGDTIFPATGSWSILWMYRHESDLNIASLLAVLYGDVAATIHCGTHVASDGSTVTLRGANGGSETVASGSVALEVGREYRFSLIHNSVAGTVTFCNDGIPLLSMSFSPAAGTAGSRSLHFAGYGGASAGSPPGNVDSTWARMRIWTAALTEAEQKAEFRSATPVRTSGLVNDWPMPAGSGRFTPASGTTQVLKIYPTTPLVDGTAFGTGPAELIFRNANDGSDSSLTNPSIIAPAPSGVTQNDLEVMWGYCGVLSPGVPPTMAAPTGWTRVGFQATPYPAAGGAVNVRGHLFCRIAPASNGSAVLNAGTNAIFVYSRSAYSNGHAGAFGQVVFGSGGPATSAVLSSLTTARARSLLSAFITQGAGQAITPPSDMTERRDNGASGVSLHDKNQLAAGPSGTKTFTLPGSADFGWGFAEFYADPGAVTGTLAKTLDSLSLSAAGVAPIAAAAAITLGGPSLASTAAVRVAGQVSALLGAINAAAAATVRVAGSAAITLDDLGLSATGVVGSTPVIGSAAITLGALGVSAAGQVQVSGTAANTLGPLGLASAGAVRVNGSAAMTLGALSLSAAGTVGPGTVTGSLSATLAPLSVVATAVARVTGALSRTLDPLSLSAAGAVRVAGQAAITFDGLQVAATGGGVNLASASITLGALTLSATGVVLTLSQEPSLLVAYVPAPQNRASVSAENFTAFVPAEVFGAGVPEGDHTATV